MLSQIFITSGSPRGENDDGFPFLGEVPDNTVYLALCSHIDAASRLVKHEQSRIRKEAF